MSYRNLHLTIRKACFVVGVALLSFPISTMAQDATESKQEEKQEKKGYAFEVEKAVACTEVKSQDRTGTCWSFATSSFVESELLRMGKGKHDLSEMFIVKNTYKDKANNYFLRQGKANFSEGALAHDLLNTVRRHGLMPEEYFSGLTNNKTTHDHSDMAAILQSILEKVVEKKIKNPKWRDAFDKVLDVYMGTAPKQFSYQGKTYTPAEFAKSLEFNPKDYVSLTSYTHHPFNESFVLEIPDNFSNGSFHNVPIDDLVKTIDNAIANGYSVAWDGDVSESGFNSRQGLAILPKQSSSKMWREPVEELKVTQEMRQKTFETLSTTDDHLMHLTGIARDKNGNKYYIIKNSWGEIGKHKGYLYMSEAYVRLKTVAILVHKDGIPKDASGAAEGSEKSSPGPAAAVIE